MSHWHLLSSVWSLVHDLSSTPHSKLAAYIPPFLDLVSASHLAKTLLVTYSPALSYIMRAATPVVTKASELHHRLLTLEHHTYELHTAAAAAAAGQQPPSGRSSAAAGLAKTAALICDAVMEVAHLFLWADQKDPHLVELFFELKGHSAILAVLGPPGFLSRLPPATAVSLSLTVLRALTQIFTNLESDSALYYLLAHFANAAMDADYGLHPVAVPPPESTALVAAPSSAAASSGYYHAINAMAAASPPMLLPLIALGGSASNMAAFTAKSIYGVVAATSEIASSTLRAASPPSTPRRASAARPVQSEDVLGSTKSPKSRASSAARSFSSMVLVSSPTSPLRRSPSSSTASTAPPPPPPAPFPDHDRAEILAHYAAFLRAVANRALHDDAVHTLFQPDELNGIHAPPPPRQQPFPLLTHTLDTLLASADPMVRAALSSVVLATVRAAHRVPLLERWLVANAWRVADTVVGALLDPTEDEEDDGEIGWVWPWIDELLAESPPLLADVVAAHVQVRYVAPCVLAHAEFAALANVARAVADRRLVSAWTKYALAVTPARMVEAAPPEHRAGWSESLAALDRAPAVGVDDDDAVVVRLNPVRRALLAAVAGSGSEPDQVAALDLLIALARHPNVAPSAWDGCGIAPARVVRRRRLLASLGDFSPQQRSSSLSSSWSAIPAAEEGAETEPNAPLLRSLVRVIKTTSSRAVFDRTVALVVELTCVCAGPHAGGGGGAWEPIIGEAGLLAAADVRVAMAEVAAGVADWPSAGSEFRLPITAPVEPAKPGARRVRTPPRSAARRSDPVTPVDRLVALVAVWHVAVRPLPVAPAPLAPRPVVSAVADRARSASPPLSPTETLYPRPQHRHQHRQTVSVSFSALHGHGAGA
ncbi:hypothetical protein H9P43_008494 [Blastocladiella emersonii ATCC 22665]|nr:hypothetical protein H9P43_008494 [Blastocladiella emersonii ATCC 22665]